MSRPESATPALLHLIGAYVNQDWAYFYDDVWAAVDDFVAGTPETARIVPQEVTMLLEKYRTEDTLRGYLDELDVGYLPGPDEGGYRGWLIEVSRRVQAATSES